MLILLPTPLAPSGVVTWAVRLASALAERGRNTGLLIHGDAEGPLAEELSKKVRLFQHPEIPAFDTLAGDLGGVIPAYRRAIEAMGDAREPVVVSPNLHADCYACVAAVAQAMPERVRVVGWAHSDNRYDARVLTHYEPMLHAFVGVSGVIEDALQESMPVRADDVHRIAYGVPMQPIQRGAQERGPLRLVYTGRLEEAQKRVSALIHMSRVLEGMGVEHELRIVGDGPALETLERDATSSLSIVGTRSFDGVREALRWADAFVLPSRYEGLSVSMLEAMACGCAPVVAHVRSGSDEAIEDGVSGVLIDTRSDDDAESVGEAFAQRLAVLEANGLATMGRAAARVAASRFGIDRHAERVGTLIDTVCAQGARGWPASRAIGYRGGAIGSGSTSTDAPRRLREALEALAGTHVALHGAGQHTRDLAGVLATHLGDRVVAICDDDPRTWGTRLWNWPVIAPDHAHEHGVEAVVISTHLHEEAVWSRRDVYESRGIAVVRLYA